MKAFERELASLKGRALEMGAMAEAMVAASARAILHPGNGSVAEVRAREPALDGLQIEIDGTVIRLITVYTPAARNLRFLLMLARINSEFERIGDQAMNNCEYAELLRRHPPGRGPDALARMSAAALSMTHDALEAFQREDVDLARRVMERDDEMDALNAAVVRDVLEYKGTPEQMAGQSLGLLIARSLERIADHATNVCEEVFYLVKGEDIRHQT